MEKLIHSHLFNFACVGVVDLTGTAMIFVDKIVRVVGPSHFDVVHNEGHSLQKQLSHSVFILVIFEDGNFTVVWIGLRGREGPVMRLKLGLY